MNVNDASDSLDIVLIRALESAQPDANDCVEPEYMLSGNLLQAIMKRLDRDGLNNARIAKLLDGYLHWLIRAMEREEHSLQVSELTAIEKRMRAAGASQPLISPVEQARKKQLDRERYKGRKIVELDMESDDPATE